MADKPLHVQVAIALGEGEGCCCGPIGGFDTETGICPRDGYRPAKRYDTDWSATGPLIERLKLYLYFDAIWIAQPPFNDRPRADEPTHAGGPTPLLAVCRLILALHAAGKLNTSA